MQVRLDLLAKKKMSANKSTYKDRLLLSSRFLNLKQPLPQMPEKIPLDKIPPNGHQLQEMLADLEKNTKKKKRSDKESSLSRSRVELTKRTKTSRTKRNKDAATPDSMSTSGRDKGHNISVSSLASRSKMKVMRDSAASLNRAKAKILDEDDHMLKPSLKREQGNIRVSNQKNDSQDALNRNTEDNNLDSLPISTDLEEVKRLDSIKEVSLTKMTAEQDTLKSNENTNVQK